MRLLPKKAILATLVITSIFSGCSQNEPKKELTMPSKKQQVVELIHSIETGNRTPIAYINPNKYIQHNLAVKDGLEGFAEVMQMLPKGSAKAEVVRAFQDGDYVFTHTKYDFFGPKAGFDIFRFEEGKIVEHWDNLQEIVAQTASGRTQFDDSTEIQDLDKT